LRCCSPDNLVVPALFFSIVLILFSLQEKNQPHVPAGFFAVQRHHQGVL